MRGKGIRRVVLIALLAFGIATAGGGTGWTQQVPPAGPAPESDSTGLKAMAAVAAAVGSFFYIPFKAAGICPGMALAAGVSWAAAKGESTTAKYLLDVGCRGTYWITPEMVRGQEEFQGAGAR